ncbi:MAG: ketoacyl-ACP synthase III [Alistipes sp.]|jgi:3-oxoacyl-[acyl-carrier-protein] synthase-3|nr:ketoacyl-ACP synthase III [Alistipes sp.]
MSVQETKTHTYINATGFYVPEKRIPNSYFAALHDKPEEWFVQRTGIITRSRATEEETFDFMFERAVERALENSPFPAGDIDLIVLASYSPDDTVGTTAHRIQRKHNIAGAKVLYVSSACSSAMNGLEIIRSFFVSGIATKALLLTGDRNSTYCNDDDPASGHLWGDGAVAYVLSTESYGAGNMEIVDIETRGLGHVGVGPDGVFLKPRTDGIGMPGGRDVFNQACTQMEKYSRIVAERNGLDLASLDWFVSHQANKRIISHVCHELGFPEERALNNIEELGNTGCGSSLLSLAQHRDRLRSGDSVMVATFGGGYSVGAVLLRVV